MSQGLLVGFPKELRPVRETAGHESGMDEVELLAVDPGVFRVVNDELGVWRDAGKSSVNAPQNRGMASFSQIRLARAKVNSCHLAFGVLIGCRDLCK